jgi:long-chain acyl-CoA synthetase
VAEAAVIGVPDEILGEAPKAFIALKMDSTRDIEAQLTAYLKGRLALYKIPKFYEFRNALPKNEAGKIQKLKLQ